jgi:hypothetical protein
VTLDCLSQLGVVSCLYLHNAQLAVLLYVFALRDVHAVSGLQASAHYYILQ